MVKSIKNMKKFIYTIASLMFTGCVKDEIYVPPTPEASEILLNELMSKDPVTDVDWIELYNAGDADVDISGYLLNDKADPTGGFSIPDGTIITAKGYYLVDQTESGIAISSGGEDVSLGAKDGTLLDYIFCEASNGDGTTFGRETDGADTWVNGMIATPGASNGHAEVLVPIVTLDFPVAPAAGDAVDVKISYVTTETVVEARVYYALGDTPAYVKDNKIKGEEQADFTQTGVTIPMKSVVDDSNLSVAGELVSFYVRIALESGLEYYYDKDGNSILDDGIDSAASDAFKADPTQWNTYKAISGGVSAPELTIGFSATPTKGYEALNLVYSAEINIVEARVYFGYGDTPEYVKSNKIKGEDEDSFTQTDVSINMANIDVVDADDNVIGNTSDGNKISFYVRIALENGTEYYYDKDGNVIVDDEANTGDPADAVDADAFKADPSKWSTFTAKDAVTVSKFEFPATPSATGDINVVAEYVSSEDIIEARIYYTNSSVNAYVKGNKIKGEEDDSFTQTGVTINMAGYDVEDDAGTVVGTTNDGGATISFYLRIATATSEYYFGKDGALLAVDDSPADGATDTSDAFKADTSLWQTYTVQ